MSITSSSSGGRRGLGAVGYPLVTDLARPGGCVVMPRLPRLQASGYTVHVVGRCNNREFCFTTPDDFRMLIAHLGEIMDRYLVPEGA